jgi:hypothetical protein
MATMTSSHTSSCADGSSVPDLLNQEHRAPPFSHRQTRAVASLGGAPYPQLWVQKFCFSQEACSSLLLPRPPT